MSYTTHASPPIEFSLHHLSLPSLPYHTMSSPLTLQQNNPSPRIPTSIAGRKEVTLVDLPLTSGKSEPQTHPKMLFNPSLPSAMAPAKHSRFPVFEDGDVTVSLSPSATLILHSAQLQHGSKFFNAGLSQNWSSNKLSDRATMGSTGQDRSTKRYELSLDEEGHEWFLIGTGSETSIEDRQKDIRRFNLSKRDSVDVYPGDAATHTLTCEGLRHMSAQNPFSDVLRAHWDLFALIYDQKLRFRSPKAAKLILSNIVFLADMYECLPAISKPLEHCIILSSHAGYKDIAEHPCFYLNLAAKVRSTLIYEEAIRHAIGRWDNLSVKSRNSLADDVASQARSKREQLHLKVAHVRKRISKLEGWLSSELPNSWLAAAIFRDWACSTIFQVSPTGDRAAYYYTQLLDESYGGLEFYTELGSRSNGYAPFLAIVDQQSISSYLVTLQDWACDIARPLLEGYPGEVPAKFAQPPGLCYFTHCKISFKDLPWASKVPWDGWLDSEAASAGTDETCSVGMSKGPFLQSLEPGLLIYDPRSQISDEDDDWDEHSFLDEDGDFRQASKEEKKWMLEEI